MPTVDPFSRPLTDLADDAFLVMEESTGYGAVLEALRTARAGSMILTKDGAVAGVFTERDILNKCLLEGTRPETPVRELMSPRPSTLPLTATVREAIALMDSKHVRNLPLVDGAGAPKGLLTVGRLIRFLAYAFPAEVVNLPPRPGQVAEEADGA
ncbi:MAG: CBS domain-containing protein [Elusimicrobia bacterium]|nr:CBS domain-containing protein [Elusimicrobiota bacterium]